MLNLNIAAGGADPQGIRPEKLNHRAIAGPWSAVATSTPLENGALGIVPWVRQQGRLQWSVSPARFRLISFSPGGRIQPTADGNSEVAS